MTLLAELIATLDRGTLKVVDLTQPLGSDTYSARNATLGSTRDAPIAGTAVAMRATTTSANATTMYTAGSRGDSRGR